MAVEINVANINTADYWDGVYRDEAKSDRQRVDRRRLDELGRWISMRAGEVGRPMMVLDIGCGRGDVERELGGLRSGELTMVKAIFGLDISPMAIAECHRRFPAPVELGADEIVPCEQRYRVFDVNECSHGGGGSAKRNMALPFADGAQWNERFDLVWCGETLEHIDDPKALLLEMVRMTGDGGFIVISTPYRGRNQSPEHVREYSPEDVWRWSKMVGELVFLDCAILPGWITMFAVMRRWRREKAT